MASIFSQSANDINTDDSLHKVSFLSDGINYSICPLSAIDTVFIGILGFIVAVGVFYIFYRNTIISAFMAVPIACIVVCISRKRAVDNRIRKLRLQFKEMLEAMNVSMRAGNNEVKALENALKDLHLIYRNDSDIIVEVKRMLACYNSGIALKYVFRDLAERSGLDDIKSFAAIYETIEGKSDKTSDIMRQTQQVISDKIQIENEIETMIASTKSEQNIMFVMPVVIVGAMNFLGGGFMDVIYTTFFGRIIATITIVIFITAFLISQKMMNIDV